MSVGLIQPVKGIFEVRNDGFPGKQREGDLASFLNAAPRSHFGASDSIRITCYTVHSKPRGEVIDENG